MTPSKACIDLIKEFEGFAKLLPDGRVAAYPDPATGSKPYTIAWGITGADITRDTVWTMAQCEARFEEVVNRFGRNVAAVIGDAKTTQSQYDALCVFCYNIGIGAFGRSTLLALHRAGKYKEAAEQFARWTKANGKVMKGLIKRRAAEAELYRK